MILKLARLPQLKGPHDDGYNGKMPTRALFAAPDVAKSIAALEQATGGLTYTDIFRSADAQLAALHRKRGVQRPAYSGHGFGLSFDLDIDAIMDQQTWSYGFLLNYLGSLGWFCHRRDGNRGLEDWHFNFLGSDSAKYLSATSLSDHATWGRPVEMRITERYGFDFHLEPIAIQDALMRLGLYKGALDGKLGPLSKAAIEAFQRAWELAADGVAGEYTQRTLAYVAADIAIEDLRV